MSFFTTIGKRTAWNLFQKESASLFDAFAEIGNPTGTPSTACIKELVLFTIKLYGIKSLQCTSINEARKILFATENRPVSNIPPTLDALTQHILRASYQAGQIWGRSMENTPVPSPSGWGWVMDKKGWIPLWTKQDNIWPTLRTLDKCGCKIDCCSTRCQCFKQHLCCTLNCKNCRGNCTNKR